MRIRMNFITWNVDLNTGIHEIDAQHKQIVDHINQLYDISNNGEKNLSPVKDVMALIIDYTMSHFGFEEELLEKSGYKEIDSHKNSHLKFKNTAFEFLERIETGEDVVDELFSLLHDWLFVHILHEDAQYVPVVLKYLQQSNK